MKKVIAMLCVLTLCLGAALVPITSYAESAQGISLGDSGDMIKTLQQTLQKLGYFVDEVDGYYGESTQRAVELFQETNGLPVSGITTAETISSLFSQDAIPFERVEPPVAESAASESAIEEERQEEVTVEGVSRSDDFIIIKDYVWDSYGSYYHDLVIRNTSGEAAVFKAQVMFYDKDDALAGVGNFDSGLVADGFEALLSCRCDTPFDHFVCNITKETPQYQKEGQSIIDVDLTVKDDKVIIVATNTGGEAVSFVEYNCRFLDGAGNVIGSDWGFLTDTDGEIKPGNMEFREASCYKSFSSVDFYYSGTIYAW